MMDSSSKRYRLYNVKENVIDLHNQRMPTQWKPSRDDDDLTNDFMYEGKCSILGSLTKTYHKILKMDDLPKEFYLKSTGSGTYFKFTISGYV